MKKLNNKGFSLVELIIVIAIMVILVGVLAPQFIKYVESSRQSTDIQNAAEIRAAIEAYVAENSPSADITVSVGSNAISVSGAPATALTDVGLSTSTPTKSTGWGSGDVAVYDHDAFTWTVTTTVNSKDPGKDLASAFQ